MVICLERGADLHIAQLMPLPLTVSCSSKTRLVLPFWYRLTWVVPEKGPLNECVCVSAEECSCMSHLHLHSHLHATVNLPPSDTAGHYLPLRPKSRTFVWDHKFGLRLNQYAKCEVMLNFSLRPKYQTKSLQLLQIVNRTSMSWMTL